LPLRLLGLWQASCSIFSVSRENLRFWEMIFSIISPDFLNSRKELPQ